MSTAAHHRPTASKERMHIDLEADNVEAEVDRLEQLGATPTTTSNCAATTSGSFKILGTTSFASSRPTSPTCSTSARRGQIPAVLIWLLDDQGPAQALAVRRVSSLRCGPRRGETPGLPLEPGAKTFTVASTLVGGSCVNDQRPGGQLGCQVGWLHPVRAPPGFLEGGHRWLLAFSSDLPSRVKLHPVSRRCRLRQQRCRHRQRPRSEVLEHPGCRRWAAAFPALTRRHY